VRRCGICGESFRSPWPRQRYCDPCFEAWDRRWCHDGHEHEWEPLGRATVEFGPCEGATVEVEGCPRCGLTSLSGITAAQYIAHREFVEERRGWAA